MSEEESLYQWFNRCFWRDYIGGLKSRTLLQVESTVPRTPVTDVLRDFQSLDECARSAGLYMSRNEELDDVSSTGLLMLVIPYVIGDILYNDIPFETENRIKKLVDVQNHWEEFLEKVEQIDVRVVKVDTDDRSRKLESHRRQQFLRPVVSKLSHALTLRTSDMDDFRDDIVAMLELFALKVQNDLRFVVDELLVLQSRPSDGQEDAHKNNKQQETRKLWSMKLDKTRIRTIMQQEVFRPDITMPTISLEEFAQWEYDRIQDMNKKSVLSELESCEDQFYKAQRKEESQQEIKDRSWDDWKDDNPRGSGNKLVNRG
jgi:hypothetical protein